MTQLDGLHMRVDSATGAGSGTASAGSYNKSRSIFVGNLHFAAQVHLLLQMNLAGMLLVSPSGPQLVVYAMLRPIEITTWRSTAGQEPEPM